MAPGPLISLSEAFGSVDPMLGRRQIEEAGLACFIAEALDSAEVVFLAHSAMC